MADKRPRPGPKTDDTYKTVQTGWFLMMLLGLGAVVTRYLGYVHQSALAFYISLALLILVFVFNSLTIEISDRVFEFRLGLGLFRRRIPLSEISWARKVKNPWYYGWGIRWTPDGWLYNVHGFDAVELSLKNGKKLRVGTGDPYGVLAALKDRLGPSRVE